MFPAINIILALLWAGMLGGISLANLASGFLLGYLVLYYTSRGTPGHEGYFGKVPKLLGFLVYYLWELLKSNAMIAYDVLTPSHHMTPGVIGIPLDARTDLEITVLANLITMTPGTLSLDISADRKTLFVHAMYIRNPDDLRADIKNNLERRVLELLR
jgi:multicomponent Na+:H+ antiporter subunit E